MRIIETKAYKFAELSEEAKQKALESFYDTNVNYDWWDFIYDDAKNVGIKITGFDLDRNKHCDGDFIWTAEEVAQKILEEHGDQCETYKTAQAFLNELTGIKEKYKDAGEDDWDEECEIENAVDEFRKSVLDDYSIILQNGYEYLTSEEAIIEAIEANKYEFTENGKRI